MATIKVVQLLKRAQQLAVDETEINWDLPEWLSCFNEAVITVANARADSTAATVTHSTDEGSKQIIPSDGIRFLTLTRNLGSGYPIRKVERRQLDDRMIPWHNKSGDEVNHFVHDPIEPKVFYIYPQPAAGHEVELVYQRTPNQITISNFDSDTQVLPMDDVYYNALLYFTLSRAYMKDADYIESSNLSAHYEARGYNAIGVKSKSDGGAINESK
ncbi:DUF6682 family protein [Catenovulum sediminis]|uniref:DUF6682 family protein n=1 Tax=Catenovulum sediminis TaxID=1740262 RepID=A0ABV1RBP4_9ALTE